MTTQDSVALEARDAGVERVRGLRCWRGPVSIRELPGGMTNRNFVVEDGAMRFVARLGADLPHLGIYRRNEALCQKAAHERGVAPRIVHREEGVLVSTFIHGRTLAAGDFRSPELLDRLAETLRRLHAGGEKLRGEMVYFSPFQTVQTYAVTACALGAPLPEDISALLADTQALARAMAPFTPVLCHNDLLPANVLLDAERLWLVDWEYAGIGNPLFDLAGVASNCGLDPEQEAHFVAAYAGRADRETLRQVEILQAVSLLREALWGAIQSKASGLAVDYLAYSAENLEKFRAARERVKV